MTKEGYDLRRFVEAQSAVIEQVYEELRAGEKRSHWMWFIFPQIRGLGRSAMADKYGISSREEAVAYSEDEILGGRLRKCTRLVNKVEGRTAGEIFGFPDDLKFHSSMTLFAATAADPQVFAKALEKYFGGKRDGETMRRI
jgi:uncharacterized protein (DUF1810 family)